jgi:hypothetical protein
MWKSSLKGRRHLGLETQRQWSDKAIARTTPALLGLFSLVCLMAYRLLDVMQLPLQSTTWYLKQEATFSDVLAFVMLIVNYFLTWMTIIF